MVRCTNQHSSMLLARAEREARVHAPRRATDHHGTTHLPMFFCRRRCILPSSPEGVEARFARLSLSPGLPASQSLLSPPPPPPPRASTAPPHSYYSRSARVCIDVKEARMRCEGISYHLFLQCDNTRDYFADDDEMTQWNDRSQSSPQMSPSTTLCVSQVRCEPYPAPFVICGLDSRRDFDRR